MLDHRDDISESKRRGQALGMWIILIYLALIPPAIYFLVRNLT